MHGSCTGAWRVLAAAVSLTACGPTEAADGAGGFPSRPVRFIVPFSAGSQTDILARILGQKLAEVWGQPVVADNRPSAGGTVAGGIVATSAPDGHTMMMVSPSLNSGSIESPRTFKANVWLPRSACTTT